MRKCWYSFILTISLAGAAVTHVFPGWMDHAVLRSGSYLQGKVLHTQRPPCRSMEDGRGKKHRKQIRLRIRRRSPGKCLQNFLQKQRRHPMRMLPQKARRHPMRMLLQTPRQRPYRTKISPVFCLLEIPEPWGCGNMEIWAMPRCLPIQA